MFEGGDEDFRIYTNELSSSTRKKIKNNKNQNQRRFSDDQIKSLESIFETESRLESQKKLQLAKELGLQPRQVGIWFQNKRARWKSKQLERDYVVLQANYNSLASRFESLKKEKLALATQLEKLKQVVNNKPREEVKCCFEGASLSSNSEDTIKICNETEVMPRLLPETTEQGGVLGVVSDEDSSIKADYLGIEEEEEEPKLISIAPDESWGSLDLDSIFYHCSGDYQWWDVWT